MDAVEKSITRHREKVAAKSGAVQQPVPWGCGLGWPELKDFDSMSDYIAARRAHDSEYAPGHDGRLWLLPG